MRILRVLSGLAALVVSWAVLSVAVSSDASAREEKAGSVAADTSWLVPGPPGKAVESVWIDVLNGGIAGTIDGASLQVVVLNKRDVDLRLDVRFRLPGGERDCEVTCRIRPGMSERFACRVETLRPRKSYGVAVRVSTTGLKEKKVDRVSVAWRFSRKDVAAIEESIRAAVEAREAQEARDSAGPDGKTGGH